MGIKMVYQTSDGKSFKTKDKALDHEEALISATEAKLGNQIYEYLIGNYGEYNADIMIRVGATGYTFTPAENGLTDGEKYNNMNAISAILSALMFTSRSIDFEYTPTEIFNQAIAAYSDPDNDDYTFGDVFGIYTRNE